MRGRLRTASVEGRSPSMFSPTKLRPWILVERITIRDMFLPRFAMSFLLEVLSAGGWQGSGTMFCFCHDALSRMVSRDCSVSFEDLQVWLGDNIATLWCDHDTLSQFAAIWVLHSLQHAAWNTSCAFDSWAVVEISVVIGRAILYPMTL